MSHRPKVKRTEPVDDAPALRVTIEVRQRRGRGIEDWPGRVAEIAFRSDQLGTPLALSRALEVACYVLDDQADELVEDVIGELGVKGDPEQN